MVGVGGVVEPGQFGFEKAFEGVEVDRFELAEALHPDRGSAQRIGFGQPVGLFGKKRCQDTAKHVRDISRLSGFRKARVFNNAGAAL